MSGDLRAGFRMCTLLFSPKADIQRTRSDPIGYTLTFRRKRFSGNVFLGGSSLCACPPRVQNGCFRPGAVIYIWLWWGWRLKILVSVVRLTRASMHSGCAQPSAVQICSRQISPSLGTVTSKYCIFTLTPFIKNQRAALEPNYSYLFYSIPLVSHAAAMHSISTRVSPPKLIPTAVRAGLFSGKNSA